MKMVTGARVTRSAAGEYSVNNDKSRNDWRACRRYSNASCESWGCRSMTRGRVGWLLEMNKPELNRKALSVGISVFLESTNAPAPSMRRMREKSVARFFVDR